MKIKSLSFMGVLLSAVLVSSMFLVGTTISEFPPGLPGEYSPWGDLNDDGKIDIFDLVWMAGRYGETGTEVNKTALLYDVSSTFIMLLDKINALNSTVIEQQTIINNLNSTVILLNETITIMNSTGLSAPDYDSGWRSFPQLTLVQITHNLGTTDIIVYMFGRHPSSSQTHQRDYGVNSWDVYNSGGAFWEAKDANAIYVMNCAKGSFDNTWGSVRVLVWKIPQP